MLNVKLSNYWDMLNAHDWFHMYSDDNKIDRAGSTNMRKLSGIAGQSVEHSAMLIAFRAHHFSGKPWNTEQSPLPSKPTQS